jgi:hypothetical protein
MENSSVGKFGDAFRGDRRPPYVSGQPPQSVPIACGNANVGVKAAVGEDSTGEEGAKLALDEAWDDAALIAGGGEKGLEVMLHGAVEDGGLGRAPLVLRRIGQFVSDQSVTRHEQKGVRVACPR